MKYTLILFMLFQCIAANGQSVPASCETMVLKDGKSWQVLIDSFRKDIVYYKRCVEGDTRVRAIPLANVREVQWDSNGSASPEAKAIKGMIDSLQAIKLAEKQFKQKKRKSVLNKSTQKPDSSFHTVWTFSCPDKKDVLISSGDMIKIVTKIKGRSTIRKGEIVKIDENQVLLRTSAGKDIIYEKADIAELRVPTSEYKLLTTVGWMILLISLAVIIGIYLSTLGKLSGGSLSLGQLGRNSNGCLIFVLSFVTGIVLVAIAKPDKIEFPFNGDWKIEKHHPHPQKLDKAPPRMLP